MRLLLPLITILVLPSILSVDGCFSSDEGLLDAKLALALYNCIFSRFFYPVSLPEEEPRGVEFLMVTSQAVARNRRHRDVFIHLALRLYPPRRNPTLWPSVSIFLQMAESTIEARSDWNEGLRNETYKDFPLYTMVRGEDHIHETKENIWDNELKSSVFRMSVKGKHPAVLVFNVRAAPGASIPMFVKLETRGTSGQTTKYCAGAVVFRAVFRGQMVLLVRDGHGSWKFSPSTQHVYRHPNLIAFNLFQGCKLYEPHAIIYNHMYETD